MNFPPSGGRTDGSEQTENWQSRHPPCYGDLLRGPVPPFLAPPALPTSPHGGGIRLPPPSHLLGSSVVGGRGGGDALGFSGNVSARGGTAGAGGSERPQCFLGSSTLVGGASSLPECPGGGMAAAPSFSQLGSSQNPRMPVGSVAMGGARAHPPPPVSTTAPGEAVLSGTRFSSHRPGRPPGSCLPGSGAVLRFCRPDVEGEQAGEGDLLICQDAVDDADTTMPAAPLLFQHMIQFYSHNEVVDVTPHLTKLLVLDSRLFVSTALQALKEFFYQPFSCIPLPLRHPSLAQASSAPPEHPPDPTAVSSPSPSPSSVSRSSPPQCSSPHGDSSRLSASTPAPDQSPPSSVETTTAGSRKENLRSGQASTPSSSPHSSPFSPGEAVGGVQQQHQGGGDASKGLATLRHTAGPRSLCAGGSGGASAGFSQSSLSRKNSARGHDLFPSRGASSRSLPGGSLRNNCLRMRGEVAKGVGAQGVWLYDESARQVAGFMDEKELSAFFLWWAKWLQGRPPDTDEEVEKGTDIPTAGQDGDSLFSGEAGENREKRERQEKGGAQEKTDHVGDDPRGDSNGHTRTENPGGSYCSSPSYTSAPAAVEALLAEVSAGLRGSAKREEADLYLERTQELRKEGETPRKSEDGGKIVCVSGAGQRTETKTDAKKMSATAVAQEKAENGCTSTCVRNPVAGHSRGLSTAGGCTPESRKRKEGATEGHEESHKRDGFCGADASSALTGKNLERQPEECVASSPSPVSLFSGSDVASEDDILLNAPPPWTWTLQQWRMVYKTPSPVLYIQPDRPPLDALLLQLQNRTATVALWNAERQIPMIVLTFRALLVHAVQHLRGDLPEFDLAVQDLRVGTYTELLQVPRETPLFSVVEQMNARDVAAVPVVDSKGAYTGCFTRQHFLLLALQCMHNGSQLDMEEAVGDVLAQVTHQEEQLKKQRAALNELAAASREHMRTSHYGYRHGGGGPSFTLGENGRTPVKAHSDSLSTEFDSVVRRVAVKPSTDLSKSGNGGVGEGQVEAAGGDDDTEDNFSSPPVTVREAILRVLFSPLRRVILLDSEGRLAGIVTASDIAGFLVGWGQPLAPAAPFCSFTGDEGQSSCSSSVICPSSTSPEFSVLSPSSYSMWKNEKSPQVRPRQSVQQSPNEKNGGELYESHDGGANQVPEVLSSVPSGPRMIASQHPPCISHGTPPSSTPTPATAADTNVEVPLSIEGATGKGKRESDNTGEFSNSS
ncbi:cbs domain-containing protein [Cystoisospora suis]|uniref:Cbs domain-containing protein n=1 Tax=Cystoisospora suis TaxID=483139 RepID=A0A2C6KNG1_9APIC|nr:cbs domain-containing protein [Cystoisospora suis]